MRHPAAPGARGLGRPAAALAAVAGLVLLQSLAPAAAHVRAAAGPAHAHGPYGRFVRDRHRAAHVRPQDGEDVARREHGDREPDHEPGQPDGDGEVDELHPEPAGQEARAALQSATTAYPVVVAECPGDSPGTTPADLAKCFGAANPGGITSPAPPYGQTTEVYGTTSATGTGTASIQLQTSVQNQKLGL